jgi:hypothetical protein
MPIAWVPQYQDEQAAVEIQGIIISSHHDFNEYISSEFPERIRHYSGIAQIEGHLRNMKDTGFHTDDLESELNHKISKSDWGEYFAYHQLETSFNMSIPWPSQWDKKKNTHSLPGADIIGLKNDNGSVTFVFGEVKTSEEMRYPPQVVTKRSDGLITQLMKFDDRKIISNLIQWLLIKSHGKTWESDFDSALQFYLTHDRYFSCVGILIRDTEPTIGDLSCVPEQLTLRCKVSLYAFYLPEPLHECIKKSIPRGLAYAGY